MKRRIWNKNASYNRFSTKEEQLNESKLKKRTHNWESLVHPCMHTGMDGKWGRCIFGFSNPGDVNWPPDMFHRPKLTISPPHNYMRTKSGHAVSIFNDCNRVPNHRGTRAATFTLLPKVVICVCLGKIQRWHMLSGHYLPISKASPAPSSRYYLCLKGLPRQDFSVRPNRALRRKQVWNFQQRPNSRKCAQTLSSANFW